MLKRSSGILLHISSLPGKYGIGDFGEGAYSFVDFLVKSNQKYWQILPLGLTGFGDSPYQCFSAFAGNPYFIDLDELINEGYLSGDYINKFQLYREKDKISYDLLYKNKMEILRTAYNNAKTTIFNELDKFFYDNKAWLRKFSLFMGIKDVNPNSSWLDWEEDFQNVNSNSVLNFEKENQESIYFWVFTQYLFSKQWEKLRRYANQNGIKIIGDLPIYVAIDSSDVWGNPQFFNLDPCFKPITVSGVPPDDFSDDGQLWGNPIYNWTNMEDDGYDWWVKRIAHSFKLFDSLRIDHFIGFESYWEVEYEFKNAINGRWAKGPGIKLFDKIKQELGDLDIVAEDLGVVTDEVRELIKTTGFPGMKVMQFSFNPHEDSEFAIHNHTKNSIVYTGTHDSSTVMGWVESESEENLNYAIRYLNICKGEPFNWAFIRGAWSSTSYLAIAPIQDFLGLGDSARMNTPSTLGANWVYRVDKSSLTDELAKKISEITKLYKR